MSSSGQRLLIMSEARTRYLQIFKNKVTEMIEKNPFKPGDCIVTEIAKAAAEEMGVPDENVSLVHLQHHWRSAEFDHHTWTSMPHPPKRGMRKEPPVKTTTRFKVVAKSGIIEAWFAKIDEDSTFMGPEEWICRFQRPTITKPAEEGGPSSPT